MFILSKSILTELNMKLKRFLWNGNDEGRAKAKVDWEFVCKPKIEGGLGIIDLVTWNKAAQLKHI